MKISQSPSHDSRAMNILMSIYISLNFGNRNKLIKQKALFMKTIFSDFSHQSCLQLEEKLFFIIALEEVNYVTCSLKTDAENHCILVSILKHLRQVLKCCILWQLHLLKFILQSFYSFYGFCSTSIVPLPSNRYFSNVIYRMAFPSLKCPLGY